MRINGRVLRSKEGRRASVFNVLILLYCLKNKSNQMPVAQAVILATQEAEIRRTTVRSQSPRQIAHKTLSQKIPNQKRAVRVVQVVECLPTKHEGEFKRQFCQKKKKKNKSRFKYQLLDY
jgi:hypothetical protein